ncbi:UV-endonuclease UvdE-domain-containing protein [Bombardia bombarda]|uniref:UV-endonuclease UvdE-domain-containing protein n=1 Tax=Bombardia bombarda TaxID=252184 RepID=A0AA39WC85_9PEZI|nr:UV-endonuclease UvdE-domain-containing protein [Bombardia bombarda]
MCLTFAHFIKRPVTARVARFCLRDCPVHSRRDSHRSFTTSTASPTTVIMPPKRKASSTPNSREEAHPDETTAPTRPEVKLRRSSRRLTHKSYEEEEEKTREIQEKILGLNPEGDEEVGDEEMKKRRESAKEGVQSAIEGLARMERRLKTATKRQKQKIEESEFVVPPDLHKLNPFNPRPTRNSGSKIAGPLEKGNLRTLNKHTEGLDIDAGAGKDLETAGIVVPEELPDLPERGAARAPPVNSNYLPLPWKGRLGYACLNTYLRTAKPPVFSSRTCRMASIIDHRYPLQDPSQPEHHTKNRPDKAKDPLKELGQQFVQELGLANARDIVKMLRWNDKYGIKLFRLSSEMFPFASHQEHGYKLAPFASEVLAEAGKVAAEFGHRLTTHPGQFTQIASPRKEVVTAAIRDLEYHDELLSLLRLPDQQNRDAVVILHMGGTYGDKPATLDRFRDNYVKLPASIKARLVLENDDVAWSVHDLLPICEELNIPLVLDYHHHNIIFDASQCREGTLDISQPEIMNRIAATWTRKGITQKMHYSEPCAGAVTPRDRRKHSPRVATLPPCPPTMDLMIEAKDKEQAVFELMRTFKLPGFERINDVVPYEREDENRAVAKVQQKNKKKVGGLVGKKKKGVSTVAGDEVATQADEGGDSIKLKDDEQPGEVDSKGKEVSEEDFAMGGPDNRVYWPLGMEEWLKPRKREVKKGKVVMDDDDDAIPF